MEVNLDAKKWLVEYKNGAGTTWDSLEEAQRHFDEDICGRNGGVGTYFDPADFIIREVTLRELLQSGNTVQSYDENGEVVEITEE